MQLKARTACSLALLGVAACHETTTAPQPATAPNPTASAVPVVASLIARTPPFEIASPGAVLPDAPTVEVRDQWGHPIGGISVTFTITDGKGVISEAPVTSDANGVASAGAWVLGTAPGQNTVRAALTSFASVAPVYFTGFGFVPPTGTDNSTFNLASIDGSAVPTQIVLGVDGTAVPTGGDCGPCGALIGGRIVLANDSTYTFVNLVVEPDAEGVFRVDSSSVAGAYVSGGSRIDFYADGRLWFTTSIIGDVLTATFGTPPFDDTEVYVRTQPSTSQRRKAAAVRSP